MTHNTVRAMYIASRVDKVRLLYVPSLVIRTLFLCANSASGNRYTVSRGIGGHCGNETNT